MLPIRLQPKLRCFPLPKRLRHRQRRRRAASTSQRRPKAARHQHGLTVRPHPETAIPPAEEGRRGPTSAPDGDGRPRPRSHRRRRTRGAAGPRTGEAPPLEDRPYGERRRGDPRGSVAGRGRRPPAGTTTGRQRKCSGSDINDLTSSMSDPI